MIAFLNITLTLTKKIFVHLLSFRSSCRPATLHPPDSTCTNSIDTKMPNNLHFPPVFCRFSFCFHFSFRLYQSDCNKFLNQIVIFNLFFRLKSVIALNSSIRKILHPAFSTNFSTKIFYHKSRSYATYFKTSTFSTKFYNDDEIYFCVSEKLLNTLRISFIFNSECV